ncbi:MAG: hypothetical protein QM758_29020 [Armatimonas sp.]
MKPELQRYLAVGLLFIGVLGAGLLIIPKWVALNSHREELSRVETQIASTIQSIQLLRSAPKGPPFAHMPATPTEELEFLSQLNNVARACGVKVTKTKHIAVVTNENGPTPDGPKKNFLPPGIDPAILTLTVEGTYQAMATFFQRLETYPRLVSITDATMKTGEYPIVSADFTLTRYTTPQVASQ